MTAEQDPNGRHDVIIVGGGHGGAQAAIALRQAKFEGSVLLIGAEPDLPYERPALSKDYLGGERSFERILLRPEAFWRDRGIDMRLGERVVHVDPTQHTVATESGVRLGYGDLIWAAGGGAKRLRCEGGDLIGVHTVRSRADVDRMASELKATKMVVVIGGGYVGLEAAAVLAKAGKGVTLLEAQDRVLSRVAGVALSRFYEAEHRSHGVDVRLGAAVARIIGDDGRVVAVELVNGERLKADMVIVGIGLSPTVEPLLQAGADGGDGVLVDASCRTSLPQVYAIGDCALHANSFAGGSRIRLESVQNANDQATTAARSIAGQAAEYHAVPWFWSNQYDLKLQTVGLSTPHEEALVRGDPASRSFSVVYLRGGRVVAIDCVNAVRDYVQGKRLVERDSSPDRSRLVDPQVPLKQLV